MKRRGASASCREPRALEKIAKNRPPRGPSTEDLARACWIGGPAALGQVKTCVMGAKEIRGRAGARQGPLRADLSGRLGVRCPWWTSAGPKPADQRVRGADSTTMWGIPTAHTRIAHRAGRPRWQRCACEMGEANGGAREMGGAGGGGARREGGGLAERGRAASDQALDTRWTQAWIAGRRLGQTGRGREGEPAAASRCRRKDAAKPQRS